MDPARCWDSGPVRPADHLVDTAGLGPRERAEVCRRVLHALGETVGSFETDVPWTDQEEWSEATRAAAVTLLTAAGRAIDTRSYQATGMVRRDDDEVWDAFCLVAGHAYDASALRSACGRTPEHCGDPRRAVAHRHVRSHDRSRAVRVAQRRPRRRRDLGAADHERGRAPRGGHETPTSPTLSPPRPDPTRAGTPGPPPHAAASLWRRRTCCRIRLACWDRQASEQPPCRR